MEPFVLSSTPYEPPRMGDPTIYYDLAEASENLQTPVVTIGNFDGVHVGHQAIFEWVAGRAHARGLPAVALTFRPHPVRYFRPDVPEFRLTPDDVKFRLMGDFGLDAVVALPFDEHLATLAPDAFVRTILLDGLNVDTVAVGANFRFGQGRAGSTDDLRRMAAERDVDTRIFEELEVEGEVVSSTRIREALADCDVSVAERLLGHPYSLYGTVVHGEKRGRQLGYPTANIDAEHLIPGDGIYAARLTVGRETMPAATSIGVRPTFEGEQRTVEAFVLDAPDDLDLYDRRVALDFVEFIRPEEEFETARALVAQMDDDVARVREILSPD